MRDAARLAHLALLPDRHAALGVKGVPRGLLPKARDLHVASEDMVLLETEQQVHAPISRMMSPLDARRVRTDVLAYLARLFFHVAHVSLDASAGREDLATALNV